MSMIKQSVGIDVSKDELDVVYGRMNTDQSIESGQVKTYRNNRLGYSKLATWLERQRRKNMPLQVVMEATGVYYEKLAYYLQEKGYQVVVVLPNTSKAFGRSLNQKSKTDKIDARLLLRFGLERKQKLWEPTSPVLAELRSLLREREQILERRTITGNQLHALAHSYRPNKASIRRQRSLLRLLERQAAQIEIEVKKLLRSTEELREASEICTSITGIGELTAACAIAETNLFSQVTHGNQLTSYIGLDPMLRESGKFKGKVKISCKGNSHLRRALYWPAIVASQHNPQMKKLSDRLKKNKEHSSVARVAVMRKLLVLMWTLWKKKQKYDPTYGMN